MQRAIKRSIPALGTFFEITYLTGDVDESWAIMSQAFAEVQRLESILSFHNEESELSKFNNSGTTSCHELKVLLRISKWLGVKTGGIFNPINHERKMDFGGIAKGYIVDVIAKMLIRLDMGGIINAGGDIRIFGNYTTSIHIRDPFDYTQNILLGVFSRTAIASSCITENSKERGGKSLVYQPSNVVHASVIGRSCTLCDAMTKVVLTNPKIALETLKYFGYEGVIFDEDNNKFTT